MNTTLDTYLTTETEKLETQMAAFNESDATGRMAKRIERRKHQTEIELEVIARLHEMNDSDDFSPSTMTQISPRLKAIEAGAIIDDLSQMIVKAEVNAHIEQFDEAVEEYNDTFLRIK